MWATDNAKKARVIILCETKAREGRKNKTKIHRTVCIITAICVVCVQITYVYTVCTYANIYSVYICKINLSIARAEIRRARRAWEPQESHFSASRKSKNGGNREHTDSASEKKIRINQTTKTKCCYEKSNNNAIKNSAWSERCVSVCVLGSCLGVCECVCEVIIFSNDAQ